MSWLSDIGNTLFGGLLTSKRTIVEKDAGDSSTYFNVFSADNSKSYGGVNVNHQLTRDLYRNVRNDYALSAQLLKPIIDSAVSFIDTPTIRSENSRVLSALQSCMKRIDSDQIIRITEREGTCFVWIQYDKDGIHYVIPRPETVTKIQIDPQTKEVVGYRIEDNFSYATTDNNEYSMEIVVEVNKDTVKKSVNGVGTVTRNVLGFIPIVRFTNDAEPWELRGHSEIVTVEPQLKVYHDLMVDTVNAQKQNTPKLKITAADVATFVDNNFGAGKYERMKGGEGINMNDRNVFILKRSEMSGTSDDMEFVTANKATGDSAALLEMSFANIAEGAQLPEFMFGASMGASLSSVQEQKPAFIKKIKRKQEQYGRAWKELLDMSLDILGYVAYAPYKKDEYELVWPYPDFATDKEKAETANSYMTAFTKARASHIMSDAEIYETLETLNFVKLKDTEDKHMSALDATSERMLQEVKDENTAKNNSVTQNYATNPTNTAVEDPMVNTDAE